MYNRYLKVFISVADCGSFSKAAEEMYISPNAVIKQINKYEEHLGFALFQRSHRGMMYTRDDDLHRSPFGEPPVVCNYFYHEEVRKSAKKKQEE